MDTRNKSQSGAVAAVASLELNSWYNKKKRITISGQIYAARAIEPGVDVIEIYSDSAIRYYWSKIAQTNIKTVTGVTNNAGVAVFAVSAHGYINTANSVVLWHFGYNGYNVFGAIANKSANAFEVGTTPFDELIIGDDSDFDTIGNWNNVDINSVSVGTNALVLTPNSANQYIELPIANYRTNIGESYTLTFDVDGITGTWTVQDFTGNQTIGKITATGAATTLTYVAEGFGGLRLVADAASSVLTIDDFDAGHSDRVGFCGLVYDDITGEDETIFPAAQPILLNVPKGKKDEGRDVMVFNCKQVNSIASQYVTLSER